MQFAHRSAGSRMFTPAMALEIGKLRTVTSRAQPAGVWRL